MALNHSPDTEPDESWWGTTVLMSPGQPRPDSLTHSFTHSLTHSDSWY